MTSAEAQRIRELEREVKELRRANEILRTALATTEQRTFVAERHDNGSTTSITSITYVITPMVRGGTAWPGSVTL